MNSTRRYAIAGTLFGFGFPVVGTLIESWRTGMSLLSTQSATPLLWIIDTAPFWLGLFASLAGRRQDRLAMVLDDLRSTNARLVAAAKVKSQFLATMSHELRTPLNAVIGFSRILLRTTKDKLDDRQTANLQLIQNAGQQLLHLVNDVLDLERIEAETIRFTRERTSLRKVLDGIQSTLAPAAEKKQLDLTFELLAEDVALETDPARLTQIITNLVNNAIRYSEAGRIRVKSQVAGGRVAISVSDQGIGIPQESLARIFEEFYQVDSSSTRERDGAGLGLAIVQKLTAALGGSIAVESEVGKGSVFTVSLPLPKGGETETSPDPAGTGPIVLLIDDRFENLRLVSSELSEKGFRVHSESDGARGLEAARKLKPDVIILDLVMPGMDGWQVLRQLRSDPGTSPIPVVISSVLDRDPRAFELGAVGWLVKAIQADEFRAVLASIPKDPRLDVLVVDDDGATQALLEQELGAAGFRVRAVGSGEAALAALGDRVPAAVILDLGLPGLSGAEILEKLWQLPETRDVPVVIYTGKDLDSIGEPCRRAARVVRKHGTEGVSGLADALRLAVQGQRKVG